MSDDAEVSVVYAHGDQDIIAVHQFLCSIAGPNLPYPVDHRKSVEEIWRLVNHDVVLMAVRGNHLVGALGLCVPEFWWGKAKYLANRFFFVLPNERAGLPLLREAKAIAVGSNMELHIYDEGRTTGKGRLAVLNRQPPVFANSPNLFSGKPDHLIKFQSTTQ